MARPPSRRQSAPVRSMPPVASWPSSALKETSLMRRRRRGQRRPELEAGLDVEELGPTVAVGDGEHGAVVAELDGGRLARRGGASPAARRRSPGRRGRRGCRRRRWRGCRRARRRARWRSRSSAGGSGSPSGWRSSTVHTCARRRPTRASASRSPSGLDGDHAIVARSPRRAPTARRSASQVDVSQTTAWQRRAVRPIGSRPGSPAAGRRR